MLVAGFHSTTVADTPLRWALSRWQLMANGRRLAWTACSHSPAGALRSCKRTRGPQCFGGGGAWGLKNSPDPD